MGIHRVLFAASVAAAVASAASADVTFALTHFHACGLELKEFTQPGDISGIITGVTVNVWMEHATAYTYADDLSIYLDTGDLSPGGQLAVGGMNTMQADLGALPPALAKVKQAALDGDGTARRRVWRRRRKKCDG